MADKNKRDPVDDDALLEDAIPIDEVSDEDGDELLRSAIPIDESSSDSGTGDDPDGIQAVELANGDVSGPSTKIRAFGNQENRHDEKWSRSPNTTGRGAIHVKTFVTKLRLDAIEHMDQLINEWLDAHPEYEVKLVTTSVGELLGKTKEQAIFMSVWV